MQPFLFSLDYEHACRKSCKVREDNEETFKYLSYQGGIAGNQHSDCEVDSITGSAVGSSGSIKKTVGKSDKGIWHFK